MPLILRALRRGMQRSVSTMCAQVEALYVVMSTCCRILKKNTGFLELGCENMRRCVVLR